MVNILLAEAMSNVLITRTEYERLMEASRRLKRLEAADAEHGTSDPGYDAAPAAAELSHMHARINEALKLCSYYSGISREIDAVIYNMQSALTYED